MKFLEYSADFLENRPDVNYSYDQAHATIPTVIKRTLYLAEKGDIEGRKLIFFGDDDATSILVGLTNLADQITVIDIDKEVLNFLSNVSSLNSIKNMPPIANRTKGGKKIYISDLFNAFVHA